MSATGRGIQARCASANTYLWDIIRNAIPTRPLRNGLHNRTQKESFAKRRIPRNILRNIPETRALELLLLGLALGQDLGVLLADFGVVVLGLGQSAPEFRERLHRFFSAVFRCEPPWGVR